MNSTVYFNEHYNSTSDIEAVDDIGYRKYHGYVSGTICFLGIFGNIFSIIVWITLSLKSSAIHRILVALAFADLVTVTFFFIYANYLYTATSPHKYDFHSESGMYLVLICFHGYIVASTTSSWLTISLAIFRYIKVCKPDISEKYCNCKRTNLAILLVLVFVNITSFPYYFYYEVYDVSTEGPRLSGYWLRRTMFAVNNRKSYQDTLLWLCGVIMKVIPCIGLIVLSGMMIRVLYKAEHNLRDNIQGKVSGYSRTTVMLITIVLVYVVTALPIGIAAFDTAVSGVEGHFFFFLGYSSIGNLLNLCPITNSSVNFWIYLVMSRRFRSTFVQLIFRRRTEGERVLQSNSTDNTLDDEKGNQHVLKQLPSD